MFGSCRRCSFFVCVCVSVFFKHPTLHFSLSLSLQVPEIHGSPVHPSRGRRRRGCPPCPSAPRHLEKVTMCINKRRGKFGEDILNNDCGRLLYRSSKLEPCGPCAGSAASHIFRNKHIWVETLRQPQPLPIALQPRGGWRPGRSRGAGVRRR